MTTTQAPATGADVEALLARAKSLLLSINNGEWIANGLSASGGLGPGEETTKPIQRLDAAGLGYLTPRVQPLQNVANRLTLHTAAIQTYADAWKRTGQKVDDVARRLSEIAVQDTSTWFGLAGDNYRTRADEMATALEAAAMLCAAQSVAAVKMGAVAADGRRQVNELLNKLGDELISYVKQAEATSNGVTADTMAEATKLINSYAQPIAALEQKVMQSATNLLGPGGSGRTNQVVDDDTAIAPLGILGQIYKAVVEWLKGEVDTELPGISPPGTAPQRTPKQPSPKKQTPPPWIYSGKDVAVNKKKWPYPQIIDPRTMQPITFPGKGLTKVPANKRAAPLTSEERAAYIKDFEDRGYKLLPGQRWEDMQLHHITPREYGGKNTFDNLVPVQGAAHRELFNRWWQDY
jgi:hypothetical protein